MKKEILLSLQLLDIKNKLQDFINNFRPTNLESYGRDRYNIAKQTQILNNLLSIYTLNTNHHWSRKWQPTPESLPGKFQEQWHLAGYSPWGCKEMDKTEHYTHTHTNLPVKLFYKSFLSRKPKYRFPGEFFQIYKEQIQIVQISYKVFRTVSNFYEAA